MIKFYLQSVLRCAVSWGGYLLASLRESLSSIPNMPARIAVVQLGHLGDIVLTAPLLRAIGEKYPAAAIDFITVEYSKEIAQGIIPANVNVLVYNSSKYSRGVGGETTAPDLRSYNLVFYIRGDLRLLLNSFRNLTAGFISCLPWHNKLRWSFLYHLGIPLRYSSRHQYEVFHKAATRIGVSLPKFPEVQLASEWNDESEGELQATRNKYMVVHPGAPWPFRRWPAESFAAVCSAIQKKHGFKIVVIGGKDSSSLVDLLRAQSVDHVFLGESSHILRLAPVFKNCSVYLGNDSGPAHLAAACGASVVALYGPETPAVFGVKGKRVINVYDEAACSPCWQLSCPHGQKCLKSIKPEMVLSKIQEMLA